MQTLSESIALLMLIIIARTRSRSSWFETASPANSRSNFKRTFSRRSSAWTPSLSPASIEAPISRRVRAGSRPALNGNSPWSALRGGKSVTPVMLVKLALISVAPFVVRGRLMRPIPLGDNSERVAGCAKSAGLSISLGRGERLFRGLRMLERVRDSPGKLTTEGQEARGGRGGKVFW